MAKPKWILKDIPKKELNPYLYPSEKQFKINDLQIVYLGWFLGDWSLVNNALYSVTDGLNIRSDGVEKTGDLLGVSALDDDWVILNQMIKYLKFGFGRASDLASMHIRRGRITREDAMEITKIHDGKYPFEYLGKSLEEILKPLEIDIPEFDNICDRFTNKQIFKLDEDGNILKDNYKRPIKLAYDN